MIRTILNRCTLRTALGALLLAAAVPVLTPSVALAAPPGEVTFTKDVAPILQRSCQAAIGRARWRRCP